MKALIFIAASVLLLIINNVARPPYAYIPQHWSGYGYGIGASCLLVASGAYLFQKKRYSLARRPLSFFFSAHVYAAWAALVLGLFHAGFKVRGLTGNLLVWGLAAALASGYLSMAYWKALHLRQYALPTERQMRAAGVMRWTHLGLCVLALVFLISHILEALSPRAAP